MAWIESHRALADHPKTRQLRKLLHISLPQTIGHLHLLWWWALAYAPNGVMWNTTPESLAEVVHWTGDPRRMWLALIQAGFLEISEGSPTEGVAVPEGSVIVHDWLDYQGRIEQQRESRALKRREANRISQQRRRQRLSANVMDDVSNGVSKMSATTGPNLTGPNLTGPNLPPMPPHDVSADAHTNGATQTLEPACCSKFAQTQTEHLRDCPRA